jgi:hypothetical protein
MPQVLAQPAYMEDHLAVLDEQVAVGLVPLPHLPQHKQVRPTKYIQTKLSFDGVQFVVHVRSGGFSASVKTMLFAGKRSVERVAEFRGTCRSHKS